MFKQHASHEQNHRTSLGYRGGFIKHDPSLPHRLSLYQHPPQQEVTIEQFERYALDRLMVLKSMEGAQLRKKSEEDYKASINDTLAQWLPLASDDNPNAPLAAQRSKDRISHFILRLAYCRTHRFTSESSDERQRFLEGLHLGFKTITPEEKRRLLPALEAVAHAPIPSTETFVEVPFEEALELVQRRQVHLIQGLAYVPSSALITLVASEFRRRLQGALEATARALPRVEADDRLLPLLTSMGKQYLGKEYVSGSVKGKVTAGDVDNLAPLMPLCMKEMHSHLQKENHLRHGGRMQFGLFLKGIGLPIEEALVFWRQSFSKITDDQFAKNYAYNIRHNYGLEGKRVDYSPYNCMRIITSNQPGPGDHHGCPFRHMGRDGERIRARMLADGLSESDAQEVVNLVAGQHYQIACTKHFELSQKARTPQETGSAGGVRTIEHPNQYFDQAYRLREGLPLVDEDKAEGRGKW
ncbi:DNA primase, large subunit [Piptocephalis cylindrospora]|uniref:DNA primase, large subunit n=1 Tax=Piptocephalis cylindrospora TaxID=1907219 RepID=A0A4P9Y881_9FUNG|nr:DNA primase, large subunit [Piptocephalis cylindrospora]|eukprot:RKP15318.1 DNA primase, large subunit [Piptocephalis cylindrospora]